MEKIKVGDFCRVKKSKYLDAGTFVEILMEFQEGIFLCGSQEGNTIVIADNLQSVKGAANYE